MINVFIVKPVWVASSVTCSLKHYISYRLEMSQLWAKTGCICSSDSMQKILHITGSFLNHSCFYDTKTTVSKHKNMILAEHIQNSQVRFSTLQTHRIMRLLWALKDSILNNSLSQDHITVTGFWKKSCRQLNCAGHEQHRTQRRGTR